MQPGSPEKAKSSKTHLLKCSLHMGKLPFSCSLLGPVKSEFLGVPRGQALDFGQGENICPPCSPFYTTKKVPESHQNDSHIS